MFPPYLAGRDAVLGVWDEALDDLEVDSFNRAQSLLVTGARGAGKTAVLTEFRRQAESRGFETIPLPTVPGTDVLLSSLRREVQRRAETNAGPWRRAAAVLERVGSVSLGAAGFSGSISVRPPDNQPADNARTLAAALSALARETRKDAGRGGLLLVVDELQDASMTDLATLIWTLHLLDHADGVSPVAFAAAALPQVSARLEKTVSFGQRILRPMRIPAILTDSDAREAITIPASQRGLEWDSDALHEVLTRSGRHPAFIQLYADALARYSRQGNRIVFDSTSSVLDDLDREIEEQFVTPRFSRMTNPEIAVLAALDRLGGSAGVQELRSTLAWDPRLFAQVEERLVEWGDVIRTSRDRIEIGVPHLASFLRQHAGTSIDYREASLDMPEIEN